MDDLKIDLGKLTTQAENIRSRGHITMFHAINQQANRIISVANPVKKSTPDALSVLHNA